MTVPDITITNIEEQSDIWLETLYEMTQQGEHGPLSNTERSAGRTA